ncbi:coiled-coil domain-containing protein 33 isoform X4 [Pelodiscus sinensis]|uniref:coiled-coil domain-containing protein 33 isoform X4 n=1 Tax=Pelodiscus sinensis TaxID=13735 RepID=UPI000D721B32|nr:coiled-coil domain-containing protein 33 isoform X5 [Pelodiscus sinensis]|eukprot:XP_025039408.1 coiled-coil domain-containing protein 33 isoform X5 [Pelodiscus sinensis]
MGKAPKVVESPCGADEAARTSETNHWHLAHTGKESISVTLHGATNLPATQKGTVPWPYVTVKSSSDVEKKREAQGVTHVSAESTHSPTWEEKVTMEIDAEDAGHEDMILTVADKVTKEVLASYKIPVRYLRLFHHYHFKLVLPRQKDPVGTSLYATVVRKGSLIPRYVGMNYTGLEVFLQGMKNPLADPPGPIIAIARVVNNFSAYRKAMKMQPPGSLAVELTTVTFPDPSVVAFDVPRVTNQGYPQVMQPRGPPEKPTWNSSILFQSRDGATLFSDNTSLVIEYYPYKAMSEIEADNKPLGYSVLPLTNRVYRSLVAERNRNGVRVDDVPIQGTNLKTTSGAVPAVQLCMQLLGSEMPPIELERKKSHFNLLLELDNYRLAMRKMADDILSLRRRVASLEAENSTLRRNLSMHEEVGRTLLNDVDVDVMTKVEIVDSIVALKHKLAAGTVEMSRMKDRVQQLQNELIRKNDREKELVMQQRTQQHQQQTVLRKYQEKITKMKALEDTVRQQEKVIEKMEHMLEEKFPEAARTSDSFSKEFYSSLLAENLRLREELGRARSRSSPIILQQQALPDMFSTNAEKLSLLAKLEKAQGRIHVLESQLEESARKWGREKQDLSTQLLEQDHGFGRSSSTILHDFSLKNSPDPTTQTKRRQMLNPLSSHLPQDGLTGTAGEKL